MQLRIMPGQCYNANKASQQLGCKSSMQYAIDRVSCISMWLLCKMLSTKFALCIGWPCMHLAKVLQHVRLMREA